MNPAHGAKSLEGRRPGDGTALLVVDAINTFDHRDGELLLRRFAERAPFIEGAIAQARRRDWHVVWVNDDHGAEDPDGLLRRAEEGPGGPLVARLAPRPGEPLLLKGSYSAFDGTDLAALLGALGVRRVVLVGTVTEMCVRESAADAVRAGLEAAVLRVAAVPLAPAQERDALAELARLGVAVIGDDEDAAAGAGRLPAGQGE